MAQNFISCEREQALLLPPSLREWLAEDHLGWFVLDAVAEMDFGAFLAAYRAARQPRLKAALTDARGARRLCADRAIREQSLGSRSTQDRSVAASSAWPRARQSR